MISIWVYRLVVVCISRGPSVDRWRVVEGEVIYAHFVQQRRSHMEDNREKKNPFLITNNSTNRVQLKRVKEERKKSLALKEERLFNEMHIRHK